MRCVIEGWPDAGGVDPGLHGALARLVTGQTTGWSVQVTGDATCFRVEVDAADWPALARCAVLAMRLCATRGMWLWHIADDAGRLAAELGVTGLCAWRGQFCTLTGAPSDWTPAALRRDEDVDAAVRTALAAVAADAMSAMGVRGPPTEARAAVPTGLWLFEHVPPGEWMRTRQRAAVGRSMVQVDARRGGIGRISGRIEIGNPGTAPLSAVQVQITLRGEEGVPLGAVSGRTEGLPPGSVRMVDVTGELLLGGLAVHAIDIGCQVITQTRARFAARVLEV